MSETVRRMLEMMVGSVKTPSKTNANDNSNAMAPTVEEADAILARFGYVDAEAVLA